MFVSQPDVAFVEMFRNLVENKPAGSCQLDEQIKYHDYDCQIVGFCKKYVLLGFKVKPDGVEAFHNRWGRWPDWMYSFSKNLYDFNFFYFVNSSDIISI